MSTEEELRHHRPQAFRTHLQEVGSESPQAITTNVGKFEKLRPTGEVDAR